VSDPSPGPGPGSADEAALDAFDRRVGRWAVGGAAGIVLTSLGFAAASHHASSFLAVFASALAVAAAAAVVGAVLGFLFGIPRTLQSESAGSGEGTRYLANTNLEQISDWLTKILVGIGLVQIGKLPAAVANLADALKPMLGDSAGSGGFGGSLCVFSALFAFLLMYLWTRVTLKQELQRADRDIVATVRAVVTEQSSADAVALSLVDRQLTGQSPPSAEELNKAVASASKSALVLTYQRAENQRARTWSEPSKLDQHDRTIPVFRALIANDPNKQFHRHFGSLGFALKDTDPADYAGAIENLSTAIDIRSRNDVLGFQGYEWNRAAARLLMAGTAPLTPEAAAEGEADLRAAAKRLPERLFTDPDTPDQAVAAVMTFLQNNTLTTTNSGAAEPLRQREQRGSAHGQPAPARDACLEPHRRAQDLQRRRMEGVHRHRRGSEWQAWGSAHSHQHATRREANPAGASEEHCRILAARHGRQARLRTRWTRRVPRGRAADAEDRSDGRQGVREAPRGAPRRWLRWHTANHGRSGDQRVHRRAPSARRAVTRLRLGDASAAGEPMSDLHLQSALARDRIAAGAS